MKVRRWFERIHLKRRIFLHASRLDPWRKRISRWTKYLFSVLVLILHIILERISRIADIELWRIYNKVPTPLKIFIVFSTFLLIVGMVLSTIVGWGLMGAILGISLVKTHFLSTLGGLVLINIKVFLLILSSICFFGLSFTFDEYMKEKSKSFGKKSINLQMHEGKFTLAKCFSLNARVLEIIRYERLFVLRVFIYGFLIILAARYILGIPF